MLEVNKKFPRDYKGINKRSMYDTECYVASVINLPNIRDKVNYEVGVPLEKLTPEVIGNKKKLIRICEVYLRFKKRYSIQSDFEKDINSEIESILDAKNNTNSA